jgi:hypothetical protein
MFSGTDPRLRPPQLRLPRRNAASPAATPLPPPQRRFPRRNPALPCGQQSHPSPKRKLRTAGASRPRCNLSQVGHRLRGGYRPSIDQAALAAGVSLEALRARNPRSFRRLETALAELCEAIQSNTSILSPAPAGDAADT